MAKVSWTADDDALILCGVRAGRTAGEIHAAHFPDRGASTVQRRVSMLRRERGLPAAARPTHGAVWSAEEDAKLLAAREKGMITANIARHVLPGRTTHAIRSHEKYLLERGPVARHAPSTLARERPTPEALASRELLRRLIRYAVRHPDSALGRKLAEERAT